MIISWRRVKKSSMRLMRLRCALFTGAAFGIIWMLHYAMILMTKDLITDNQMEDNGWREIREEPLACRRPSLYVMNPLIKKHIRNLGELKCNREEDWVETRKGTAFITKNATRIHGKIKCKINYLERVDDFNVKFGKSVTLTSDEAPVQLEQDFFVVKCEAADKKLWKNLISAIHRNETLVEELKDIEPPAKSMKLNVIMYGLDSMSRMHFIRKLPKTYKYLKENLKAFVLEGYNIVGDGTPQALIPILTGFTEAELPETRKRLKNATFVDVYPFVWKNFSTSGYVTAWAEEQPTVGTFTYRLKGFKEQPTDHSMRTFFLKMMKVVGNHPKLCLGNKPRHKLMLDWIQQFYEVYYDVPKFAFCFNSELSHDDYNLIGYADNDIESFLKYLGDSGILENTLLIVMSDHGHRFAPIRASQQGKQEERLPFFSFVLPPSMQEKYPQFVENIRKNQNRLVTPFDIHATFLTLLYPDIPLRGQISKRSISVFSEIPRERTCESASIESHWCACLSWSNMSTTDSLAKTVGNSLISFINNLTTQQRGKCLELQLSKVMRLEKFIPNKDFLTFKKNADYDGRAGEFSDNTEVTEIIYQIQLLASPSEGIYEAIVKYSTQNKAYRINEHEISRINMYGNQEHCIHDDFPELRKYCYCKTQLST